MLIKTSLGLATALAFSFVVPVHEAHAADTCAAAWEASKVYTAGNTASENGVNDVADWWPQGNDPATNNGGSGSGQPWTSQGSCTGGDTPPDNPPDNPP